MLRNDPKAQELFEKRKQAGEEFDAIPLSEESAYLDMIDYELGIGRSPTSDWILSPRSWRGSWTHPGDPEFFFGIEEKLVDDAWMDLKKELQRKGYPKSLTDSIIGKNQATLMDQRNIDDWRELSNELMDSSSLQEFDPSYLGDLKKSDMPDIMQGYLPGNMDDRVQDIMTEDSYRKLRDKAIELVHMPMDKAKRYPEPEQIMDAITARDFARPYSQIDRTYDASLNAALSNYAEARAKFAFSFVPVIPTGMSLYEGYQTRSGLMEKAEEMKAGMTPEEIREAERLASPPPREVDLPGSVTEGMDTVIDMVKGYMGEFGGYDSPDRIPEYDEDDDILYKSFDRDRR